MYLTPDQDHAYRFFDGELLMGPAGTSKLIVLCAKTHRLLENDTKKFVLKISISIIQLLYLFLTILNHIEHHHHFHNGLQEEQLLIPDAELDEVRNELQNC